MVHIRSEAVHPLLRHHTCAGFGGGADQDGWEQHSKHLSISNGSHVYLPTKKTNCSSIKNRHCEHFWSKSLGK